MKKNVLIYVPDGLVKDDVVATVHEVHQSPDIRIVDDIDAVCEMLAQHKDWAWAVLDASDDDLKREDLRRALSDNKALPVVLSAGDGDPQTADWVFLDPPFTTEMLRDALDRTRPY